MAFGMNPVFEFDSLLNASLPPDPATNLTPPTLVRQRAIGVPSPPGIHHRPGTTHEREGLPPLPHIPNPFAIHVPTSAAQAAQRAAPFGGDDDEESVPCARRNSEMPPIIQRQTAGAPPEPTMEVGECVEVIRQIIHSDPQVPASLRTIALRGIARVLQQHALSASSSTRYRTLQDSANALRDIAKDESIDSLLRHVVLTEITELLYDH
jgi:uncharacterized protein (UPF0147 family)